VNKTRQEELIEETLQTLAFKIPRVSMIQNFNAQPDTAEKLAMLYHKVLCILRKATLYFLRTSPGRSSPLGKLRFCITNFGGRFFSIMRHPPKYNIEEDRGEIDRLVKDLDHAALWAIHNSVYIIQSQIDGESI